MISILRSIVFLSILNFCALATAQVSATPSNKMYGEVRVMSNYVAKGITQSNKGPSIGAGLGYFFGPQAKIGFEAASVKYPDEGTNVEMRLLGEYKFIFSATSDLRVRNDFFRYFSEGDRNKVLVTLDQNFFTYHILYSYEENFEGTKSPRSWFAFQHDFSYSPTFVIPVTAGYSMVSGYSNFFDTRAGFAYLSPNITAGVYHTYVSTASEFDGQADMAFLIELLAKF